MINPLASPSEKATDPSVVIFRLGSLGDTVNSLPCFHRVVRAFPHARRVLLTNFPVSSVAAPSEVILRDGGFIHETVNYVIGERRPKKLMALRRTLKALNAKTLIYLTEGRSLASNWRDWAFFRLCGFTRIIGVPLTPDLARGRRDGRTGQVEREIERLARCLAPLGPLDLADPANWDLNLTDAERAAATAFLSPLQGQAFIAVNTGGKVKKNDWGLAHWETFLARLSALRPDLGLLVVGAQEDEARAAHLSGFWRGPTLSACGRLTPRQSAAALRHATVFVGHDSGPLHLAAAMGVACVSMFGDNNPPRKWHPVGDRHRIIHDMAGVMAISTEQVLDAVRDVLEARGASHRPNPPPGTPPAAP